MESLHIDRLKSFDDSADESALKEPEIVWPGPGREDTTIDRDARYEQELTRSATGLQLSVRKSERETKSRLKRTSCPRSPALTIELQHAGARLCDRFTLRREKTGQLTSPQTSPRSPRSFAPGRSRCALTTQTTCASIVSGFSGRSRSGMIDSEGVTRSSVYPSESNHSFCSEPCQGDHDTDEDSDESISVRYEKNHVRKRIQEKRNEMAQYEEMPRGAAFYDAISQRGNRRARVSDMQSVPMRQSKSKIEMSSSDFRPLM